MFKNKIQKSISLILTLAITNTIMLCATTNLAPLSVSMAEFKQEEIPTNSLFGDVNGDGIVDYKDYVKLDRYINCHPLGDLNGDRKVDVVDLQMLNNHITETSMLNNEQQLCADLNEDGQINILDFMMLNKHLTEESEISYKQPLFADLNGDGKVDKFDLKLLYNILHKLFCRPLGDVNGDGVVNVVDAQMFNNHFSETSKLSNEQLLCADLNGDGVVNILDAQMFNNIFNQN